MSGKRAGRRTQSLPANQARRGAQNPVGARKPGASQATRTLVGTKMGRPAPKAK